MSEACSLRIYLQEMNRVPLLSKEEEEKVARQAAQGNKAARERLIKANLRFVITVAKKYQGKGLPLEDLISEGNLGLLAAVEHFDIEKGYRFITYAVWWIRQSIIKALTEKARMIRLPSNKTNELNLIDKTRQIYHNEPGWKAETEVENIAQILNMPLKKAEDLLHMGKEVMSLDDPALKYQNSSTIMDLIVDEGSLNPLENLINCALKSEVESVISNLEERAADVIRSRYGIGNSCPQTLKEIGNRHNLSRERVRQIEKRALGQIQQSPQSKKLESYIA